MVLLILGGQSGYWNWVIVSTCALFRFVNPGSCDDFERTSFKEGLDLNSIPIMPLCIFTDGVQKTGA